ncbi:cupin domain-containing protein [Paracoccus pantotrophus]|uniref:(R)-mandelonitrile lyase n=1 Tax=Paracoccus pantotrophus TaxID=82367 RepID=UPI00048ECDBF|nr:cupin domain-containing protein [Paracoccus pantotrophus]
MRITKAGTQPSQPAPVEYFTGTVRVDPVFATDAPARGKGANVTFEPGARTHWHRHPLGQTLIVIQGKGLVQSWGGPVETVTAGDCIWFAPDEKHWHGAAPDTAMSHLAIAEALDGSSVEWLEPVGDDIYFAKKEKII